MHLLLLQIWFSLAYATSYEYTSDLPTTTYDFIVVGAGTAGNVIANRLTEDPRVSVLLLEGGGSNKNQFITEVPLFSYSGIGIAPAKGPINWNYTTVPQAGLNNRTFDYPRGFLLGGTSSINGLLYTRGSAEDYDRYARTTGDNRWSWEHLQPYIRRNELWTEPLDHRNTTGEFNPAVHGFHGINSVSLFGIAAPVDARILQTTQELPDDFPFNLDYNSGKPLGLARSQSTIGHGVRSSSATSYLADKYLNRANLHVLLHARVTKLVKTSEKGKVLTFQEVEFTQGGATGQRVRVRAKKEVVLCAGSVNTPAILMHSGIGDTDELHRLGIRSLHDLPSVGKNASDHPVTGISWMVNSNETFDPVLQNMTVFDKELTLWNRTHSGIMGTNAFSHLAYVRIPANSSIFEQFQDPTAGPNSPHLELALANAGSPSPASGSGFSIGFLLMNPVSRGSVRLASSDPFEAPLIDTGALTSGFDIFAMRQGVKMAQKFVSAPVWENYIIKLATPGLQNATSDSSIDDYLRSSSITAYHLSGTSAMTAPNAGYGVVNPDLKVKGINGVRIVDASILPFVPSGHTQAPTYIIAERAADIIKDDWT